MAVVNIRNNAMHKVVLFEAKRPVDRRGKDPLPTDREWRDVRSQLEENMLLARRSDGAVQGMSEITAIGIWARAYKLSIGSNRLWEAYRSRNDQKAMFHVVDDSVYVQGLLKLWADEIRSGRD